MKNVFYRMGLGDKEIVALSGAHTLGRVNPKRSGFGKESTKYTKDGPGVPGALRTGALHPRVVDFDGWRQRPQCAAPWSARFADPQAKEYERKWWQDSASPAAHLHIPLLALSQALERTHARTHASYKYHPSRLMSCPPSSSVCAGGSSWTPEWLVFDNSYFKVVEAEDDPELVVLPTDKAVFLDNDFRCARGPRAYSCVQGPRAHRGSERQEERRRDH